MVAPDGSREQVAVDRALPRQIVLYPNVLSPAESIQKTNPTFLHYIGISKPGSGDIFADEIERLASGRSSAPSISRERLWRSR